MEVEAHRFRNTYTPPPHPFFPGRPRVPTLLVAVREEDSDMEIPDDEGSDSDMEEGRPSKPFPLRHAQIPGTQPYTPHTPT